MTLVHPYVLFHNMSIVHLKPLALCRFCGFCGGQRKYCTWAAVTTVSRTSSPLSDWFAVVERKTRVKESLKSHSTDTVCKLTHLQSSRWALVIAKFQLFHFSNYLGCWIPGKWGYKMKYLEYFITFGFEYLVTFNIFKPQWWFGNWYRLTIQFNCAFKFNYTYALFFLYIYILPYRHGKLCTWKYFYTFYCHASITFSSHVHKNNKIGNFFDFIVKTSRLCTAVLVVCGLLEKVVISTLSPFKIFSGP